MNYKFIKNKILNLYNEAEMYIQNTKDILQK